MKKRPRVMKEPRLRIDKKTGVKCLHCYYDPKKCDWDSEIKRAEAQLGITGENIAVIAFPAKSRRFS